MAEYIKQPAEDTTSGTKFVIPNNIAVIWKSRREVCITTDASKEEENAAQARQGSCLQAASCMAHGNLQNNENVSWDSTKSFRSVCWMEICSGVSLHSIWQDKWTKHTSNGSTYLHL